MDQYLCLYCTFTPCSRSVGIRIISKGEAASARAFYIFFLLHLILHVCAAHICIGSVPGLRTYLKYHYADVLPSSHFKSFLLDRMAETKSGGIEPGTTVPYDSKLKTDFQKAPKGIRSQSELLPFVCHRLHKPGLYHQ